MSVRDRLMEIKKKYHILNISNTFFLGFDADIAFYKHGHILSRALDFTKRFVKINWYCISFSYFESIKIFNKK